MKLGTYSVWILALLLTFASTGYSQEAIDAGRLIERVSNGEDFSGQKLLLSGVALNSSSGSQKLINFGVEKDLNSSSVDNFVSVYDAPASIRKGQTVILRVLIETSMASRLGNDVFVAIEAEFLECVSC